MKPLSNKINAPLIIIAVGLLGYYHIAFASILTRLAFLVGSIYPLYIGISVLSLIILRFVFSIRVRTSWERRQQLMGRV